MTSIRFTKTAALLVATLGFSASGPARAQDAVAPISAPAPAAAAPKAPAATQVALAPQPVELKPEQLLLSEPTAAGPRAPTRAAVIEELKRARSAGAMDFAALEINGPAR